MKKFLFLIFMLFPLNVFALSTPLERGDFDINNQTSDPMTLSLNANSSTNTTFHLYFDWNHGSTQSYDLFGPYLQFSVLSTQPLEIYRAHSNGTSCTTSCFSNDNYLQLISQDNNSYTYMFFFNISKWKRDVGTQVDLWSITDQFTFKNKGSSSATVYIYGVYANDNNQIPDLIQQATVSESIIINNDNNKQEIIDRILDTSNVCYNYKANNNDNIGYLNATGVYVSQTSGNNRITNYLELNTSSKVYIYKQSQSNLRLCYYDSNKSYISCIFNLDYTVNQSIPIPNNAKYLRFAYNINTGPLYTVCSNGNQVINDTQNETNNKLDDVNNSINEMNGDMDGSTSDGFGDFFDDFEDPMPSSVTDILLSPLNLIGSISNSCSPVEMNILGKSVFLPCGTTIFWERNFSDPSKTSMVNTFRDIWNVLFGGSIIYALLLKLWSVYESLIDPTSDAKIDHYKVKLRENKKKGGV